MTMLECGTGVIKADNRSVLLTPHARALLGQMCRARVTPRCPDTCAISPIFSLYATWISQDGNTE